jgi:hypothetical protein
MSFNSKGITPLAVKIELRAYGKVYDVSNSVENWKDVEVTLKRDGTSGVFHQLSVPFEFVPDYRGVNAYDVLKKIFDEHRYRAEADVYLYLRRDDWVYNVEKYYAPQVFNLDFTTYERSDTKIEIETKKASLYDYLKSGGKVTYDIPVSEIRESEPWEYDRINLENKIVFRCISSDKPIGLTGSEVRCLGISYETTEIAVEEVIHTQTIPYNKSLNITPEGDDPDSYFMYLDEKAGGRYVNFDINISGKVRYLPNTVEHLFIMLVKKQLNDPDFVIERHIVQINSSGENNILWTPKGKTDLLNAPGWGYYLLFDCKMYSSGVETMILDIDGTIEVKYNARYKPEMINVFSPAVLLRSLVDRMTETKGVYGAEIEYFNTDEGNLIMMAAAESIRGIQPKEKSPGAQVHTSYNKFLEWMNVFGYDEHIDGNAVTLRRRKRGFREDLVAVELDVDECAGLKEYVNGDYLYSGVKTGYERKEIENANVRFEFNGLHDYSTDLNLQDNILELISPYRADCFGIEFLTQERAKDTTDDKSDKDIFLVNLRKAGSVYKTVVSLFTGNVPVNIDGSANDTLFNGNLNPYRILLLNLDLIGVSVGRLKFTASDSNAVIVIDGDEVDGKGINRDCTVPPGTGLFEPVVYDVASRNLQRLPSGENVNGIVRFKYSDKDTGKVVVYEGFIDEVSHYPAWDRETVWKLWKRRR